MREFNITGPCDPELHYSLPPLGRRPGALDRICRRTYLALSGPRQSGKTSILRAIVDAINADGWARAVLVSCEEADQKCGVTTMEEAEKNLLPAWLGVIADQCPCVAWPTIQDLPAGLCDGVRIGLALSRLARASDRPLVMVVDEVDCLAREPFGRLLRQIRAGFTRRPKGFPHSIVLAGMRNLRDHDIALGGDGSGSPFNIVEFVTVGNFTRDELICLYG